MFRLLFFVCAVICSGYTQTFERWVWADTENPIQNGTEDYPFKYISQIDLPQTAPFPELIIINFKPANSSYTYDQNNANVIGLLEIRNAYHNVLIRRNSGIPDRNEVQ